MADKEEKVKTEPAQAEAVQQEKSILDTIIEEGRMARDESQKAWAKDIISEFVSQIMGKTIVVSKDTETGAFPVFCKTLNEQCEGFFSIFCF